jgi:hypothetical protein
MKCADDCFASGLVGVIRLICYPRRARCAQKRQSDLAWINHWLTSFLLVRFVNPDSCNNFCLLPIWGFSNERKVFKVMMVEQL